MKKQYISPIFFLHIVVLLLTACNLQVQHEPELVTEEFYVDTPDAGIRLYVRNKKPAGLQEFSPDKTLLFVHGATYPASTMFDLKLDGISWMEYIASRGYDVYLVDIRGYGRSDRPQALLQAADQNSPVVRTEQAIRDFGTVVDFILERRQLGSINIMGWSWGTTIVAGYTVQNNDKVNRLVMYAPVWVPAEARSNAMGELDAWRSVNREGAWQRWTGGIPAGRQEEILPRRWFNSWWQENMAAAPIGASQSPPVIIAPNGTLYDIGNYWLAGNPLYDPADIRVPVLLAVAEWDTDTPTDMTHRLFARLVNAPVRRAVMIGEGTHAIMMESNREQLFREVQLFLDGG